jgi:outer membrane protein TolC
VFVRHYLHWFLLAVSFTVAPVVRAQQLTLASAVQLALTRNERSRLAELAVESADSAVKKARAAFLPSLNFGASETLRPYQVELNNKVVGRTNAANSTLTLSQPLFAATAFPLYAGAKHSREVARFNEVDQRRQLSFDAARAFFGVIAQQRLFAAARSRLELATATLDDTRARAEAGLVSTNDVTRSEIEWATAQQSVSGAQSSLDQSRLALEYVINAKVEGELTGPPQSLSPAPLQLSQLIAKALAKRPDLVAARENVAAASALADEPRLRFVPTLTASAQARAADQTIVGNNYTDVTALITLSWAIWDAGVRSADSDARRAALDTAQLQHQALWRHIETDVRTAVAELLAAQASLSSASQAYDAARRSADETNVLYKQGLAKAIELVDSNSSRFTAEVGMAAAQLALRQSELDLRAALGLFPVEGVQ